MRLRLFKTANFKYHLAIEAKYRTNATLIPIGCDCHPAYLLQSLNIRKQSLAFDWLLTEPLHGISYVCDNLLSKFEFFLSKLKLNADNKVYSSYYDYSVFFHNSDLIDNPVVYDTLKRRANRFLKLVESKQCSYLYVISSGAIKTNDDVETFLASITKFKSIIKEKDELLIYLRYEHGYEENKAFCQKLIDVITQLDNVKIKKYIRQSEKYGVWGDKKQYVPLLKQFDLKVNRTFPRIYIRKTLIEKI
jgi:Putative papain-like cysteine peptidase (DUF1796)